LAHLLQKLNTVLSANARGQFKGCNVCGLPGRANSSDCAACKSIFSLPTAEQLRASIALEQINIANDIDDMIIQEPIIDLPPLTQTQNNDLRNALLVVGALLLLI